MPGYSELLYPCLQQVNLIDVDLQETVGHIQLQVGMQLEMDHRNGVLGVLMKSALVFLQLWIEFLNLPIHSLESSP